MTTARNVLLALLIGATLGWALVEFVTPDEAVEVRGMS